MAKNLEILPEVSIFEGLGDCNTTSCKELTKQGTVHEAATLLIASLLGAYAFGMLLLIIVAGEAANLRGLEHLQIITSLRLEADKQAGLSPPDGARKV